MERYEELIEKFYSNEEMSDEEINEAKEMLYDRIENGIKIEESEIRFLSELDNPYDSELIDTGSKGWVEMREIFRVRNNFYSLTCWWNDMCGDDYDPQVMKKVEFKEVKRKEWVEI